MFMLLFFLAVLLDAFWYVDILLQCQYFVVLSMVFVVLGILDMLM